ncbi:MAG: pilin [Patescibacteria group bacterium]|nr:pilin [Patescibacteria group bacterium]MDD5294415.1 pilin [Patescibacteria group bacterium]MDD5554526.1 pilin [Patescibacteria group bacterium]
MPKKFPKIFTVIFLLLIILQTGAFVFPILFYTPAKAAAKWANPVDQIKIPGLKFSEPKACPDDPLKTCVPWIGEYIGGIYNYAIGIVGILAAVVLMFGGVIWLTAGGSPDKVNEAKAWIGASLSGLVLALCSYMILYQINPDLVKLNPLKVNVVTEKKIEGAAAQKCQWGVGSWNEFYADTCKDMAKKGNWENPNTWEVKTEENCEGTKPQGNYVLCCCPPCPAECQAVGCNYCAACENCTTLTIPTKNGTQLTAPLAQKLANAFSQKNNWRVTEAWPPSQGHADSCHYNGMCADINFSNGSKDPTEVKELFDILTAAGLNATYESDDCSAYTGVTCDKGSAYTNAQHFHVK